MATQNKRLIIFHYTQYHVAEALRRWREFRHQYHFYFSPNDIIVEYQTGSEKRAIKIMQLIEKTNEENGQVNVIVYDPSLSIAYGSF